LKHANGLVIKHNPMLHNLSGLDSLSSLSGMLFISSNDSLINLTGLESLSGEIASLYIIVNPALVDISSLKKINRTKSLIITDDSLLVSLTGLEGLKYVDDYPGSLILIQDNAKLESLMGLSNLEGSCFLDIDNNEKLVNLNGLENFKYTPGMIISHNKVLVDIKGLKNLHGCQDQIRMQSNPKLINLEGLENITHTDIALNSNTSLLSLSGLDNVVKLDGCQLIENPSLTTIEQLSKIDTVHRIYITDNPKLSVCEVPFLCNLLPSFPSNVTLQNNNSRCSEFGIIPRCSTHNSVISGHIYVDWDCNHVLDTSDISIQNHILKKSSNQHPIFSTNTNGNYYSYVPKNYELIFEPDSIPFFTAYPIIQSVTTGNTYEQFADLDFGFCPDSLIHDLSVRQSFYSQLRPGFNATYQLCINNNGSYAEEGILELDFSDSPNSDLIEIISTDSIAVIEGKKISWNLTGIHPFLPKCYRVNIHVDPSMPIGNKIISKLSFTSSGNVIETNYLNNISNAERRVVGSFDPNDKIVNADRIDFAETEMPLEYTILFQNTGSYPATFVEIADTLESGLNIAAFEMIGSSHPYSLSFPDTNIIKWRFDDILLPDSTSNEEASHGFIHFRINAKALLPVHSVIKNKASIYFDFNAPVITNSTSTLVDLQIKTNDPVALIDNVKFFPNPTNGLTQMTFTLKEKSDGEIQLFNSQGNFLISYGLSPLSDGYNSIPVDLTSLADGIYFVRLLTTQGIGLKKVILIK
ncbi:MAG: T9SS type A sorting domain-containing protein, partial [Saprospiraceae bacterium]